MELTRKKVGILGGTFDPIHTGHLILAEAAYESFSLDYVLIMPNGNPPHKAGQVNATMEQRTRMVELAVADNPHLKVSDFEKTPQDYHYTYETLEFLKKEHPDTDYYFILGADSLVHFYTWMEPRRICEACSILAATRDHMESEELTARIQELSRAKDPNGIGESRSIAAHAGRIAGNARRELEEAIGRSVISSSSASDKKLLDD